MCDNSLASKACDGVSSIALDPFTRGIPGARCPFTILDPWEAYKEGEGRSSSRDPKHPVNTETVGRSEYGLANNSLMAVPQTAFEPI